VEVGGGGDRPEGKGGIAGVVESGRPSGIGRVGGEGVAAVEEGRGFGVGLAADGEDLGM
jgi:hypothetical protein